MAFQRAERRRAAVKLAITGPSGSGKTFSALKLAFGLAAGAKVAFVDTETGSGSLYADLGEYDVCELAAPFTVARYQQAISEAAAGGYGVLIIDSLSHAWAGEGGLLPEKEALDARGGQGANRFTNWAPITKKYEILVGSILQAPMHVICTMRSKMDYVIGEGGSVKKVGLAPVMRDGAVYEFTTVFDVAADHTAVASKDRSGLFDGLNNMLSEDHGRRIRAWLEGAAAPRPVGQPAAPALAPQPAAPNPAAARVEEVKQILKEGERPMPTVVNGGAKGPAAGPPSGNGEEARCSADGCGKSITPRMVETSMRAFGRSLCPSCQRQAAQDGARAGA